MSDYNPTEHDSLRQDGQPDKRVGTGEFAQGKVDLVSAGHNGGKASGGDGDDGSSGSDNSGGMGRDSLRVGRWIRRRRRRKRTLEVWMSGDGQ